MKALKRAGVYAAVVAIWFALWAIPSYLTNNELILPTPTDVFSRLGELLVTLDFWGSMLKSLLRVLGGVVSATILAVIAGALGARFKFVRTLLYPFNEVVKATPIVSFIFLAYIVFGKSIGLLPVFIVMLIVFPVVYGAILSALMNVDRELLEVSDVFGCTRWERLRYLWIPTAMNSFVTSFSTALGLGWKSGIAAEALVATPALGGIGSDIAQAKTYIETVDQFAYTLAIIVISIAIGLLFSSGMKRLKEKIGE